MVWRTSRQACLLCPWARHLTGHLHLYVVDRWPTGTSPDYNCEVANPAYRKMTTLGYPPVAVWYVGGGLPVTEDWFEMGCHLFPSLISIRLTACRTSIPRKRRGNHKQKQMMMPTAKHAITSIKICLIKLLSQFINFMYFSSFHWSRLVRENSEIATSNPFF